MRAPAAVPANEVLNWSWLTSNAGLLGHLVVQHMELTVIAVVIGTALSFPMAVASYRHRRLYAPIGGFAGLLYTIPALALFAFLVPYTGLSTLTAEIGLVSYTLLILLRNMVAGLQGVPADVKEAALGMGYSRRQLFWTVELPLATPVIVAGIRIATVTTIGLVTVTALIGEGGLGAFILLGIQESFATPALVASVTSVALAVVADLALLAAQNALTPWARGRARGTSADHEAAQAAVAVGGGPWGS